MRHGLETDAEPVGSSQNLADRSGCGSCLVHPVERPPPSPECRASSKLESIAKVLIPISLVAAGLRHPRCKLQGHSRSACHLGVRLIAALLLALLLQLDCGSMAWFLSQCQRCTYLRPVPCPNGAWRLSATAATGPTKRRVRAAGLADEVEMGARLHDLALLHDCLTDPGTRHWHKGAEGPGLQASGQHIWASGTLYARWSLRSTGSAIPFLAARLGLMRSAHQRSETT